MLISVMLIKKNVISKALVGKCLQCVKEPINKVGKNAVAVKEC